MQFTITVDDKTMQAIMELKTNIMLVYERKKKGLDKGLDSARENPNYNLGHIPPNPESCHSVYRYSDLTLENILFDVIKHTAIELDDYIYAMEQNDKEKRKKLRAERKRS